MTFSSDWAAMLDSLFETNRTAADAFAAFLCSTHPPLISVNVIDIFTKRGLIKEIISLLSELLKNNKPDEGALQTKFLEICVEHLPFGELREFLFLLC